MATFRAFRISSSQAGSAAIVDMTLADLSPGDVVIRAAFSSVNYKDALAGTGTGKILRRFSLVSGLDVSGGVEASTDSPFPVGGQVLLAGLDLGGGPDGG